MRWSESPRKIVVLINALIEFNTSQRFKALAFFFLFKLLCFCLFYYPSMILCLYFGTIQDGIRTSVLCWLCCWFAKTIASPSINSHVNGGSSFAVNYSHSVCFFVLLSVLAQLAESLIRTQRGCARNSHSPFVMDLLCFQPL